MTAYPREAAETLASLADLRRRTRRSLGEPWFPMVCFGAVSVVAAPLVAATGPNALLPLWVTASALGSWLTHRHHRRRGRRSGVTGRRRAAWVVVGVMSSLCLVVALAVAFTAGPDEGAAAAAVVVAVGYAVLGGLHRDPLPGLGAAASAAVALALAAAERPLWLVELGTGTSLMAAGGALLLVERARA